MKLHEASVCFDVSKCHFITASPADGRSFESPTALTADGCRLELKEEEEGGDEEVFSLELERGEGLGLALKDSEVSKR